MNETINNTENNTDPRLDNLRPPWKPGESGNPNGAPKKELAMTGALREILLEQNPETKIERYKELLHKALSMAMRGDGDMLKYLINRIEGMPKGFSGDTNLSVVIPILGGKTEKLELTEKNEVSE